jgi:hypothetical protein
MNPPPSPTEFPFAFFSLLKYAMHIDYVDHFPSDLGSGPRTPTKCSKRKVCPNEEKSQSRDLGVYILFLLLQHGNDYSM